MSNGYHQLTESSHLHLNGNGPESVAFIHVHQYNVRPELGFFLADDVFLQQVIIEFLEGLQAFSQVLIVDLHIEGVCVFLDETSAAVDVKTSTLLD